jgi:uncharacterized protein (TIGR02271 family)
MTHTVVGLFENRSQAQQAMQELIQHGFIKENIDLSNRSYSDSTDAVTDASSTTNTGIGDSISNFFNSLFGDDPATATTYTNAAQDADAILTVQADSEERAREAAEIFDNYGAIDVDGRYSQYNESNYTEAQNYGNQRNYAETSDLKSDKAIPVIEEELKVGKREVERGGARIRSRIIEKPVEANVRLREEHVVVNRRPVNREVTQADLNNFGEGDIELTERAEVPVVGKQARVVEEVEVGKQVEEREQTIRDTVRRTDVEVEEMSGDVTDDTDNVTNINARRAGK